MEMQGDMEKQNRRKEQEYIKGLKRYEQKGIPVYIDGKKPEEEDWEKIFQIQEDGGFYMSDFIGLEVEEKMDSGFRDSRNRASAFWRSSGNPARAEIYAV